MAVLQNNEIFFTQFEPQTSNRFWVEINGIPSYLIKKCSSPSFDTGEIVLDHINIYRKLKGKVKWNDMSMELYNPITPSGAQAIMEWVRLGHESVTGRDGYSDFYKKDFTMKATGPLGDIISEWKVKGAFIKSATFGDYDWANDQAINLSVNIAMDYCILGY